MNLKKSFVLCLLAVLTMGSLEAYGASYVNFLTSETDTVYFNDFEITSGALVDSTSNPGSWRREWGWGNPEYVSPPSGYRCWGTAIQGDERLEDNEDLYLTTPAFSGRKSSVSFDSWFDDYNNDIAKVQFRQTNGSWEDIASFNNDHRSWTNFDFESPEATGDSIQFRFYLDKNDGNNNSYGWYLDNLNIETFQTSIVHEEHLDTYNSFGPYRLQAELSNEISWASPLHLVYSIDDGTPVDIVLTEDAGKWTYLFPGQPMGSEITYSYYVIAANADVHYLKKTQDEDFSFQVLENPDGFGFSLYQPANFSEDVNIYITMEWTDLGDPLGTYTIQYGTDLDFTPGSYVEKSGLTDTRIYNPVDFIKNEIYYWRVFSYNSVSGDTTWANNGEKWMFEVIPPEVPSVLSGAVPIPANRTIIPENNPYFVEGAVRNAVGDTLTVRAGVTCDFTSGSQMMIYGHMVADGTASDHITFQGSGGDSWYNIYFYHSSPPLVVDSDFNYLSGSRFRYCDFNGGTISNPYQGAFLEWCIINNAGSTRIAWGAISDCEFINCYNWGAVIDPHDHNWVEANNLVVTNSRFASGGSNSSEGGLYTAFIDTVRVNNCETQLNNGYGIRSEDCHVVVVGDHNSVDNSNSGFYATGCDSLSISNSSFNNNGGHGLEHSSSESNTTISDCYFVQNNGYGVYADCSDLSIVNSTVSDNSSYGVRSLNCTVTMINNSISGNSGWGAHLDDNRHKVIQDNDISNNSGGYWGVYSHVFTNNQIIANSPLGAVYIDGNVSFGGQVEDNTIIHNINGVDNGTGTGYIASGLGLRDIYQWSISRNTIANNNKSILSNTPDIWGNDLGSSLAAVTIFGNTNLITDNIIQDNNTYASRDEYYSYNVNADGWNDETHFSRGAGLFAWGPGSTITGNLIERNTATAYINSSGSHNDYRFVLMAGGGIYLCGDNAIIKKNQVNDNRIIADNMGSSSYSRSAAFGAGLYLEIPGMGGNTGWTAVVDSNSFDRNIIQDRENGVFYGKGCGVYIGSGAVEFTNNSVSGNFLHTTTASGNQDFRGAGVYFMDSNDLSVFSGNILVENVAESDNSYGGGYYGNVGISNSTISRNIARNGGGVYFPSQSGRIYDIDYSTVTMNIARGDIGGIYNPTTVSRTIIVGNQVIDNGQFVEGAIGGIQAPESSQPLNSIHDSNLYGNTGINLQLESGNQTSVDAENNWWNTRSDQIFISDVIEDGFDYPGTRGVVSFQPFLTFASSETPGQFGAFQDLALYTDNTYQMALGGAVDIGKRVFFELDFIDGDPNSEGMSAVRVENLQNEDYIAPIIVETNRTSGKLRGNALIGTETNFVNDMIRASHGDTIRISPFDDLANFIDVVVDTTIVAVIQGDANGDVVVNLFDVLHTIDYVLGATSVIDVQAADVNGDSYINVLDIVGIINIILGGESSRDSATLVLAEASQQGTLGAAGDISSIPLVFSWDVGEIGGVSFSFVAGNHEAVSVDADVDGVDVFFNTVGDTTKCILLGSGSNTIPALGSLVVTMNVILDASSSPYSFAEIMVSDPAGGLVDVDFGVTAVETPAVPTQFGLSGAVPNPFNPITSVYFDAPQSVIADIVVYDIRGHLVIQLANRELFDIGRHRITWNGKNDNGAPVPSGTYFFRLSSDQYSTTRKALLVK